MARVWRAGREAKMVYLYGASSTLGWRIVRRIPPHEGERGVESGRMRHLYDTLTGKLLGYQLISNAERRGDRDLPSMASAASISVREMQANAGELGASRTARLAEDDRVSRRDLNGHLLPAEDFVERSRAKVAVFPLVGSKRGDIVRAWKVAEAQGLL